MKLDKRVNKLESKNDPKHDHGLLLVYPNEGESREDAIKRVKAESAEYIGRCKQLTIFYIGIRRKRTVEQKT